MNYLYSSILLVVGILVGLYSKKLLHKLIVLIRNKREEELSKKNEDLKKTKENDVNESEEEIDFEEEDLKMVFYYIIIIK